MTWFWCAVRRVASRSHNSHRAPRTDRFNFALSSPFKAILSASRPPFGRTFGARGSNLVARTYTNSDSVRDWHRNPQITHFSKKWKNNARRAPLDGNCDPGVVQTLPIGLHHGRGWSKMDAPGLIFLTFPAPFARLCRLIHQISFRCPILVPGDAPDSQKPKKIHEFPSLPNPTDLTHAVRYGNRAYPDPLCDMIRIDGATSQLID